MRYIGRVPNIVIIIFSRNLVTILHKCSNLIHITLLQNKAHAYGGKQLQLEIFYGSFYGLPYSGAIRS